MTNPQPNGADLDRGAALVTVTMSMALLLALAALAVDGSNLYRERVDAQTAADLAAFDAAYDGCQGGSDPATVGKARAATNGYSDSDPDISVTVAAEGSSWRVTISSTIDGYFSPIVGAETLTTSATALAECTITYTPLPALFAGGTCPSGIALDWPGSDHEVEDGFVHSNDKLRMQGNDNEVEDEPTTYVTSVDISGSGNTFESGPSSTGWQSWPLTLDPNDYLPGGLVETAVGSGNFHYTTGDWILSSTVADGVWVAEGDITVADSNFEAILTLVTIPVTENKGLIDVSGSNVEIEAYYDGVFAFSNFYSGGEDFPYSPPPYSDPPDCGNNAIRLTGTDNDWEGLVSAPRGRVEISATEVSDDDSDLDGNVMGWDILFAGTESEIEPDEEGGSPSDPVTALKE